MPPSAHKNNGVAMERNGSKRGYSQFTAILGDVETGVKQRSAHSRNSNRHQRNGRRRRTTARCLLGCGFFLIVLGWCLATRRMVAPLPEPAPGGGGDAAGGKRPGQAAAGGGGGTPAPTPKAPGRPERSRRKRTPLPKKPDPDRIPGVAIDSNDVTLHPPKKQTMLPSGVPAVAAEAIPSGQSDDDLGPLVRRLFDLGAESPRLLAEELENNDPFGVNVATPDDYVCPAPEDRMTLPETRNLTVEKQFRSGEGFAYFQHLRKAGGTAFCDLAQRNMPRTSVPRYFCMPDNRGSMATPPWGNATHLLTQLQSKKHRLTSNEWDALPAAHVDLPGAVYVTSMRHPIDRWYSQYRFEHIEKRDGSKGDRKFGEWYKRSVPYNMGNNYYVKTFCGSPDPPVEELRKDLNRFGNIRYEKDLYWSYHKFSYWGPGVPWPHFKAALKRLQRFDVLLVLEFLDDYSFEELEEVLGWHEGFRQVLPHEKQARREVKVSVRSKDAMSAADWAVAASNNAFDMLLYYWVKRLVVERYACRAAIPMVAAPAAATAAIAAAAGVAAVAR